VNSNFAISGFLSLFVKKTAQRGLFRPALAAGWRAVTKSFGVRKKTKRAIKSFCDRRSDSLTHPAGQVRRAGRSGG
jgi:hypothetical protein